MLNQQLGVWKETFVPEKSLATETGNKEMPKIILNIHRDEVVIEGQKGHDDCIAGDVFAFHDNRHGSCQAHENI